MADPERSAHPADCASHADPPRSLVSPPLFMAADIRAIEQQWVATHPDESLMEKAGAAAAELAGTLASESGEPVLILAGPGNNGGDALVAARRLHAAWKPRGRRQPRRPGPPAAGCRARLGCLA